MPDAVLVHENGIRKLRTERYDRRWRHDGQHLYHLPEEDVCQALGVPLSGRDEQQGGPGIDDIMALLMGSSSAMKDREDLMRCLVFQWLTGITRVNAKHLSLLIARGGSFRLAPFKHLLSACPGLSLRTTDRRDFQLGMGLTGPEGKQHHIDAIGPAHFLALAGSVGFSQAAMRQILAAFIRACLPRLLRCGTACPMIIPDARRCGFQPRNDDAGKGAPGDLRLMAFWCPAPGFYCNVRVLLQHS